MQLKANLPGLVSDPVSQVIGSHPESSSLIPTARGVGLSENLQPSLGAIVLPPTPIPIPVLHGAMALHGEA